MLDTMTGWSTAVGVDDDVVGSFEPARRMRNSNMIILSTSNAPIMVKMIHKKVGDMSMLPNESGARRNSVAKTNNVT